MPNRMPEQIAAAFALSAFAVAVASGLLASVPAPTVLLRSLVVLLAASATGRVLGHMAMVAVREHLTATTADNPIPEPLRVPTRAPGGVGEVEIIED